MNKNLAQAAISSALKGDWSSAIQINSHILKDNSADVDALNRLARAYSEVGKLTKAKKTAQKVIKIDPFNSIASKSLKKWKNLKNGHSQGSGPSKPEYFLEEPGKTKIITLIHTAGSNTLAQIDCGDELKINSNSHKLSICTMDGKYLGRLPDDLSARLKKLLKFGNLYKTLVKSVSDSDVKVFIKEIKRVDKLADIPSFSSERIDYISFTPPELVHKKEVASNDEDDE